MDISSKIPPVQKTPYVGQKQKTDAPEAASPAAKGDKVVLSDRAKELQAALEAIQQMDDVDHEKVKRIKAQIEAGTYKVDADKIAGKIIEESLLQDHK